MNVPRSMLIMCLLYFRFFSFSISFSCRLSNIEVLEFLVQNNIQSTTELFAISKIIKDEGQRDLANFVLSKFSKSLTELFDSTWKIENASSEIRALATVCVRSPA